MSDFIDVPFELYNVSNYMHVVFPSNPELKEQFLAFQTLRIVEGSVENTFNVVVGIQTIFSLDYTKCDNISAASLAEFLLAVANLSPKTVDGSGPAASVDLLSINGNSISVSSGVKDLGTLRVTLATDDLVAINVADNNTLLTSIDTKATTRNNLLTSIDGTDRKSVV